MVAAVIDAHVHVCLHETGRYPFTPLLGYTPSAEAPVERLVERMDACGVDRAVLVQPSYYGYDNRYMEDSLARFPGRLRGVGLADPRRPAFGPDWAGVRLNAVGHPGPGWLTRTEASGFWAAAAGAGLTLCVQCTADQVAEAAAAACRHQGLRCVIDHLGQGAWAALREAAAVPNLFVKVSGLGRTSAEPYPHRDVWPAAAAVVAAFGPGRCLWGTDANSTDPDAYRAQVALWRDLLPLSPATRSAVMGGTAHRLFFGGGP